MLKICIILPVCMAVTGCKCRRLQIDYTRPLIGAEAFLITNKNKDSMEREKIFRAITGCCINDAAANEATDRVLALFSVSNSYSEQDMDNAYDKGFKDGKSNDLRGSIFELL